MYLKEITSCKKSAKIQLVVLVDFPQVFPILHYLKNSDKSSVLTVFWKLFLTSYFLFHLNCKNWIFICEYSKIFYKKRKSWKKNVLRIRLIIEHGFDLIYYAHQKEITSHYRQPNAWEKCEQQKKNVDGFFKTMFLNDKRFNVYLSKAIWGL